MSGEEQQDGGRLIALRTAAWADLAMGIVSSKHPAGRDARSSSCARRSSRPPARRYSQLAISRSAGFASASEGNELNGRSHMAQSIEVVAAPADEVWGRRGAKAPVSSLPGMQLTWAPAPSTGHP